MHALPEDIGARFGDHRDRSHMLTITTRGKSQNTRQ